MNISVVRNHALSLPEVTEEPHFDYASFRVRGKIFVSVPPGEEHVHVFVNEADRVTALDSHASFVEELHWGKKVLGLRVSMAEATAAGVKQLITQAWQNKAPKSLLAELAKSPPRRGK